jgi:hypothetical protein
LIIALHGLDGYPMSMLRWFFGFDEEGKEQPWEERHPAVLPPLDAIVVTPNGHGNTMYRELGEDDIMSAVAWAKAHYAIDDARITVTGPSMGGIGSAAVALHHPDVFAAAEPLCGYHSYFVRRDIATRPRRPWEEFLAQERSNVFWAENGRFLPMFIVHGTRDLPTLNSDVLIEKYKRLGFDMTDEHPDLGHWVWQYTYGNLRGAKWLLGKRKRGDAHHVDFKTTSPRFGDRGFVHVDALRDVDTWASVDATLKSDGIAVKTTNVRALRLDLPKEHDTAPASVVVDGTTLTFDAGEAGVLHREESAWKKGPIDDAQKRGRVTGPIRDVFHEPIVFVWGASDHDGAAANEAVARGFAKIRPGIDVHYPVMSDIEFLARGEKLDGDRALFLVGNAKENALVRALEKDFPIKVEGDAVKLGAKTLRSEEIGAMFVRPNPRHPSSYVVVVEAPTPVGTMRALSLPDILPDFVVWDRHVAPSRNQLILGAGALVAGGRFNNDWSLPADTDDPLAKTTRPTPRNEYEATPYLP